MDASPLSQHQNIIGTGQVAGGRCNDGLPPNVDFAFLPDGELHIGLANEVHWFGRPSAGAGQSAVTAWLIISDDITAATTTTTTAGALRKKPVHHIGGDVRDESLRHLFWGLG